VISPSRQQRYLEAICERFFTQANNTFNAVKFFWTVAWKLDLTGSQVLGCMKSESALLEGIPWAIRFIG